MPLTVLHHLSYLVATMKRDSSIHKNIRAHDKISADYEMLHGEIFNPVEQDRLKRKMIEALSFLHTSSERKIALDFGCGTGNLTRHLIESGLRVVSADISKRFLEIVAQRHSTYSLLGTLLVNGKDLSGLRDDVFDIVATYSVLHHVPDYLFLIREMHRVTRKGGVIYIDHELNDYYWRRDATYAGFLERVCQKPQSGLRRYLIPSNYVNAIKLIFNPRWKPEGDIHVWPDDHIEWDKVETLLRSLGSEIVLNEDYLLFRRGYPEDIYMNYKDFCSDTKVLVVRKI